MTATWTRVGDRGGMPMTRGVRLYRFRLDITSYTTGGEALTPAALGNVVRRIDTLMVLNSEPGQNADHMLEWDRTNSKIMAYVLSTGLQVGAAADIGTHEVWILGR